MKKSSEVTAQKMYHISRSIPVLMLMCFPLAGVLREVIIYFELKPIWLDVLGKALFAFEFLLLAVSLTVPGFLVVLGYPELAFAWLQGALRKLSNRLWEQLSDDEKKIVYLYSLGPLVLLLLGIVILILQYIR